MNALAELIARHPWATLGWCALLRVLLTMAELFGKDLYDGAKARRAAERAARRAN